jgi:hypothetical protein
VQTRDKKILDDLNAGLVGEECVRDGLRVWILGFRNVTTPIDRFIESGDAVIVHHKRGRFVCAPAHKAAFLAELKAGL